VRVSESLRTEVRDDGQSLETLDDSRHVTCIGIKIIFCLALMRGDQDASASNGEIDTSK
jgi:hypothetical protein